VYKDARRGAGTWIIPFVFRYSSFLLFCIFSFFADWTRRFSIFSLMDNGVHFFDSIQVAWRKFRGLPVWKMALFPCLASVLALLGIKFKGFYFGTIP
jgi:hypothetical protein